MIRAAIRASFCSTPPEGGTIDVAKVATKYGDLFQLLLWIGLGSALLFLLLAPLLRRMMHGVK